MLPLFAWQVPASTLGQTSGPSVPARPSHVRTASTKPAERRVFIGVRQRCPVLVAVTTSDRPRRSLRRRFEASWALAARTPRQAATEDAGEQHEGGDGVHSISSVPQGRKRINVTQSMSGVWNRAAVGTPALRLPAEDANRSVHQADLGAVSRKRQPAVKSCRRRRWHRQVL